MTLQTAQDQVTLYYRQGGSDKVYQARIEPEGTGFVVQVAYGRRGGTLVTANKTPAPVDYAQARKVFDKLLREKTARGYSPGEMGTPYQQTPHENRATGVLPQLLNPIEEDSIQSLLCDKDWWTQEKLDGRRMLLRRSGDTIRGINRQGLIVGLPEPIAARGLALGSQQWLMDGEAVGETLHAFDLLESACVDLRPHPYHKRLKLLGELIGSSGGAIKLVPTAETAGTKKAMLKRLKEQNREGIVFKRKDAVYTPGRPASGGDQLKVKFCATCSCIVSGINGSRRSVMLHLLQDGKQVDVGNVTIPPSAPIPQVGGVIEVRYLYAYPGGSLFQPVFLGHREDVGPDACTVAQLKFKAEESDEA